MPFPREQRAEPAPEAGQGRSSLEGSAQPPKRAESDSEANFGKRRLYSPAPAAKHEGSPAGDEHSKQAASPQTGASSSAPPANQSPVRQHIERSDAQRDALMTPEQWLLEIEQLRRDGRQELARARLDQFRKRFPDFPVPESWQ